MLNSRNKSFPSNHILNINESIRPQRQLVSSHLKEKKQLFCNTAVNYLNLLAKAYVTR